jgi:hypothetical protein
MIIWSGWGLLVPVVAVLALFATTPLVRGLGIHHGLYELAVAGLVAAAATRVLARFANGAFFFVPTALWAAIEGLGSIGICLVLLVRGH